MSEISFYYNLDNLRNRFNEWGHMKIAIFAPFAAVWPNSRGEVELAENLVREGHEILFLRCDKDFEDFCISMASQGLSEISTAEDKLDVCKMCIRTKNFIEKYMGFPSVNFYKEVNSHVLDLLENEIGRVSSTNWMKYSYEGLALGRIAAYEFFIRHKLTTYEIPISLWNNYLFQLRNTLLTYISAVDFFKNYPREKEGAIDRVIVSNSYYSSNRVFSIVAELNGTEAFTIDPAGYIYETSASYDVQKALNYEYPVNSKAWVRFSKVPLSIHELRSAGKYVNHLISARSFWTYSSPINEGGFRSFPEFLDIPKGAKVLLLAMSSADEIFAQELIDGISETNLKQSNSLFASQLEWIQFVVENIKNRDDIYLVIRPHPREFPNKRENRKSSQGSLISDWLTNSSLPPNVLINWPDQKISLYQFLPRVERLLIAWSSVAIEFGIFGKPVISYVNPYMTLPGEMVSVATSKDEYVEMIIKEIKPADSLVRSKAAFRWLNFAHQDSKLRLMPYGWEYIQFYLRVVRILVVRFHISLPKFFIRHPIHVLRQTQKKKSAIGAFFDSNLKNVAEFVDTFGDFEISKNDEIEEEIAVREEVRRLWETIS